MENTSIARRGCLKVAGVAATAGIVSAFGSRSASAAGSTLPNALVVDGQGTNSETTYTFEVTDSIAAVESAAADGIEDTVTSSRVEGTVGDGIDAYRYAGDIVMFDFDGPASVTAGDNPDALIPEPANTLTVTADGDPGVNYEVTTSGELSRVLNDGKNSAETGNDTITQNGDGTWTVSGFCGNGYGDSYTFHGEIVDITPTVNPYTFYVNGTETTVRELTGAGHTLEIETGAGSDVNYEFTTTDEVAKLLDNGKNSAETGNDTITQNGDGTWTVSGSSGNGYGDGYEFFGEVTDFSPMEGPFTVRVDGTETTTYDLTGTKPSSSSTSSGSGGSLGGGDGYANTVPESDATTVVSSRSELTSALQGASRGDIVYVAGDATIDLGSTELSIPAGVTLASDRGINGAQGGHVRTSQESTPLANVAENARVTGVRISGPNWNYESHSEPAGRGLSVNGSGVEIDNCELWGFAHAAVRTGNDTHIHHCNVHHNPRGGLGYGVLTGSGHPVIEYNTFDANRHSVCGTGNGGFTVRYNHFGPTAHGHAIDCHTPGGTTLNVHHNTVEATERSYDGRSIPAVAVRGVPNDLATIERNWFYNSTEPRGTPSGWTTEAIIQVNTDSWQNVDFVDNHYGTTTPSGDVGHPR